MKRPTSTCRPTSQAWPVRRRPRRPLTSVTCWRTSSAASKVRLRLPGLFLRPCRYVLVGTSRTMHRRVRPEPRAPLPPRLQRPDPSMANAGRRAGRPRVNVVGASHAPAQSPGWTRTTMDVQLANGSPAAPAVDVSVRVGYDGGSVEDTEVIRIIGWSDGSGDTFAPGPIELHQTLSANSYSRRDPTWRSMSRRS